MTLRPTVFLDRDGTLNQPVVCEGKPYPPTNPAEFRLYDGVPEACARLKAAGWVLVVVTNQPDVARGDQTKEMVETMNRQLLALIPSIDRIEVCYAPGRGVEHPENYRRKPAPGMLRDAAAVLALDLARSWMVGDRWADIDAGHAAGCRTVFIDRNYVERGPGTPPHFTVKSFSEAEKVIQDAIMPRQLL